MEVLAGEDTGQQAGREAGRRAGQTSVLDWFTVPLGSGASLW